MLAVQYCQTKTLSRDVANDINMDITLEEAVWRVF